MLAIALCENYGLLKVSAAHKGVLVTLGGESDTSPLLTGCQVVLLRYHNYLNVSSEAQLLKTGDRAG